MPDPQAPALSPLLVDAAGAAKLLSISRALYYSMAADGRLGPQSLCFGRRRLWRTDELYSWVRHNCPPRNLWAKEPRQ